jgi:hypothetical protein
LLLLGAGQLSFAAESVRINGFISQGYLNSDKNNFLSESRDGTFELSEVGVTINSAPVERLRVGMQLLARDFGKSGNNELRLDWAYGDYRFSDEIGVRIGKIKRPMGLYNEERDSDFLHPLVFLPQSIYDEARRDMLISYQGVGLYGTLPAPALGTLDYHLFRGGFNFPDDNLMSVGFLETGRGMVKQNNAKPLAQRNPAIPASVSKVKLTNKYIEGGQIILNTRIEGLRMAYSLLRGQQELFFDDSPTPQGELIIRSRGIYSLEYQTRRLTLATEYCETDRDQTMFGVTNQTGRSLEWYGMASYLLYDKLTMTLLYDVYYNDKHDQSGLAHAQRTGKPAYYSWRKDAAVGLRYDLNEAWTIKGEWHAIDGAALYTTAFNPTGPRRYWDFWAFKASFNF